MGIFEVIMNFIPSIRNLDYGVDTMLILDGAIGIMEQRQLRVERT